MEKITIKCFVIYTPPSIFG